jgi:DNA replication protein DnaC
MNIHQTAREILARRGINPDELPDPPPFDLAATLTENATAALALNLPPMFLNAVPGQPDVRAWVQQFLTDRTTCPSLLLLGPVGTGKTHESIGALRGCVLGSAKNRRPLTWHYTSHPKLNAELRPSPDDSHLAVYDLCEQVDLLVLDDLGAGKATDWTADTLYRLVDTRWAYQRPVIATTNLTAPDLREAVGARVASRLASGVQVALKGDDRRRAGAA